MDHPFRTAAVGGFNRQDVLNYLETVTREAAEQQAKLQQQLDEASETVRQQNADLTGLRESSARQEQELTQLREQLSACEQELAGLREQNDGETADLTQVRAENAQLKAKVAELRPGAEAYDAIKERTAGLEMEAHHRAKLVEEQSKEQARQLRRQIEAWMQKVEREYGALRTEVEATVAHAADQLNHAGQSLDRVNELLNRQDVALKSLGEEYSESDPDRVEPPMPIPED